MATDGQADAHHQEKMASDVKARVLERITTLLTEAAKAGILLNSGALVAMLGFLQALAGKPQIVCFKLFALTAMVAFLIGSTSAALTFWFRQEQALAEFLGNDYQKWRWRFKCAMAIAAAFFVAGVSIVVAGVYIAF